MPSDGQADLPPVGREQIDARVVFLTHYIPLYQVQVLRSIAAAVRDFKVLLSTPIEPNRDFQPDWSGLDVTVQNTLTLRQRWKHREAGFDDQLYVHFPYDTLSRLAEIKPDVVISIELGARSAGAAWYRRRHPESKLVLCTYMSERTERGRGWLRGQLRKRLLASADAVTFNGPSCKRYLRRFNIPEESLFHLPYAADDRTSHHGPVDRDESDVRKRLLVVGQLSARKGVDRLIDQIEDYCRSRPGRSIELLFAGTGPLRERLENRRSVDNLSVVCLGNVVAGDLVDEMLDCGAMIAPTLADEWMLAINEGLQSGLPVIGSQFAQAATTLIEDGINGWRYNPDSPTTLSSALDAYFEASNGQIAEMRWAAQASVADRTPQWAARGAIAAIRHVLGVPEPSDRAGAPAGVDLGPPEDQVEGQVEGQLANASAAGGPG